MVNEEINQERLSKDQTSRSSPKPQAKESEGWWQPAIIIFAQVTAWIAGPIIIALYLGRWLDSRYQTGPWLFIATLTGAFLISSIGIVKVTISYIKKIEKEALEKKDKDNIINQK